MQRRHAPVPLQQAAEESPTLARLLQRTRESSDRLQAVQALIPPAMRAAVRAGPIDADGWCLLVDNNAAAAKLRQLVPGLLAHLRTRGLGVAEIRLKVAGRSPAAGPGR